MPNYTTNLNLVKPLVTENYDIAKVTNDNADKIDSLLVSKNNPTFSGEVVSNGQITSKSSVMMMGNSGGTINGYLFNDSSGISLLDSTGVPKLKVNKSTGEVDIMSQLNLTNGQIKFPATQVPSADPNTLDDYEEGTWTPSLQGSGVGYWMQRGRYVKIGKEVHCSMYLGITSIGTLTSNSITGLPFIVEFDSGASIAQIYNLHLSSGYTYHAFRVQISDTTIRALQVSGVTYDNIPISGFKDGMEIIIDFTYRTQN